MSTVRGSSVRANSVRRRPRRSPRAEPLEIVDPNTFVWPERSRKNFVQLVALQCLLNPTPPRQIVQPVDQNADSREKRGGYKGMLPPKVERELTEHFAFLVAAGAGDTACCVEEEYVIDVGSTLRFRVAMNNGVPQWILDGLRGVCGEVSKLANGESLELSVRTETWRRVLELQRPRIHADLEERFSKASRPLSELFEESLSAKDANNNDSLLDEEARLMLQKIYDLCTRVVTLDREKTGKDLERLLDTCYRFRASRNFRSFLKSINNRRQLTQMIDRLGRYKSASVALVSAARKYPEMFTNLEVEAVPQLSSEAATSVGFHGIYVGDVAQELTANSVQQCLKRLRSVTDLGGEKLASRYQELCQEKLSVHAEIQMVKFYEENPHIGRPAFIGCSKKSCYLCTLFIQLEGKFDVATKTQSHYQPTLYNTWTVPTMKCSSPENAVMYTFVVDKMSRILEDSCRKILWENSSREARFNHFNSHFPLTSQVLGFEVPSGPLPSPTPVSRMMSTLRASIPALPRMPSSYNLSSGATTPTNIPLSPLSPTFFGGLPSLGLMSTSSSRVQSPGLIPMAPSRVPRKQTPALDTPATPVKPSNKAPDTPKAITTPTAKTLPVPVSAPSPRPREHTPPPLPVTPSAIEAEFPPTLPEPVMFTPDREPTPVIAPTKRETTPVKDPVVERESTPQVPNSPGAETTEGSEDLFDLLTLPIQKHSPLMDPIEFPSPTPSPPPKPKRKQTSPAKPTTPPPPAARSASGPAPLPSPPSSTGSQSKPWSSRVRTRETGLPPTPADSPTPSSGSYFPKSEPIRIKPMVNFSRPTCEFPPTPPSSCTAASSIPWSARTEPVMATSIQNSTVASSTSPKSFAAMTSRPSTPANPPTRVNSFRRRTTSPPTQTHIPRPSSKASARASPSPSTEHSSPVSSLKLVRGQTPPQAAAMAVSMATSIPRLSKSPPLRSSRRVAPVSEARAGIVTSAIALEASRSRSATTGTDNRISSDSGQTSGGGVTLGHLPGTRAAASLTVAPRSKTTGTPKESILAQATSKKSELTPLPDAKLPFTAADSLSVPEGDPWNSRGDSMEVHVAARNEDGESLHGSRRGSGAETAVIEDSVQSSLRSAPKLAKFKPEAEKELEPSFIRRRYVEGEDRSLKSMAVKSANNTATNGKPRPQGLNGVQRSSSSRRKASPSSPSKLPTPSPTKDTSSFLNINGIHRSTRNKSGGVETEYTLYLASQVSEPGQPPLGEKLFTGKLSDRKGPGEIKQRVGCRLRTELRPWEGGTRGNKMRVREVAKTLEEMVLDIFFPDAVLRLEVFWDV